MNRNDIVSIARAVLFHSKVLWKGFLRTAVGTSTAGMVALACYGYAMIPTEGGYAAVCEFLAATILLVMAVLFMYAMGGIGKKVRR